MRMYAFAIATVVALFAPSVTALSLIHIWFEQGELLLAVAEEHEDELVVPRAIERTHAGS